MGCWRSIGIILRSLLTFIYRVEEWKSGRVEEWKSGRGEEWKSGRGRKMGADLYIDSVIEEAKNKYGSKFKYWANKRDELQGGSPEHAVAQKKAQYYYRMMFPSKGYFRDSYNDSGLFPILGMSWWMLKYIDDEGEISVENCKLFLQEIRRKKVPSLACWVNGRKVKGDGEEWRRYFEKKRKGLMAFLSRAIKLGETVKASV